MFLHIRYIYNIFPNYDDIIINKKNIPNHLYTILYFNIRFDTFNFKIQSQITLILVENNSFLPNYCLTACFSKNVYL